MAKITQADIDLYRAFQRSPIFFVEKMWNLKPQPVLEEHKATVDRLIAENRLQELKVEYFAPFVKKPKHNMATVAIIDGR